MERTRVLGRILASTLRVGDAGRVAVVRTAAHALSVEVKIFDVKEKDAIPANQQLALC